MFAGKWVPEDFNVIIVSKVIEKGLFGILMVILTLLSNIKKNNTIGLVNHRYSIPMNTQVESVALWSLNVQNIKLFAYCISFYECVNMCKRKLWNILWKYFCYLLEYIVIPKLHGLRETLLPNLYLRLQNLN